VKLANPVLLRVNTYEAAFDLMWRAICEADKFGSNTYRFHCRQGDALHRSSSLMWQKQSLFSGERAGCQRFNGGKFTARQHLKYHQATAPVLTDASEIKAEYGRRLSGGNSY
jgi:hypothetical protein